MLSNDLQALDDAWNNGVLQPRIKIFRIFPHDDQVHPGPSGRNAGDISHRAKIGIQIQLLAERYVNAGSPRRDRRGHRSLEGDMRASHRSDSLLTWKFSHSFPIFEWRGIGFPFH